MRFWFFWAGGLAAWIAALVLASPWDLPLSSTIANRPAFDAQLVHYAGEIPGWLLIVASLVLLVAGRKPASRLGAHGAFRPMAKGIMIHALALPLVVTQALKLLWGRVRHMHLAVDGSDYTAFWTPAGIGAGKSFPSGHVAMAVLGASIPFFLWRMGKKKAAAWTGLAVIGWGAFVSFGRIRSASHYLTDCIFSFGLAFLVGALLARWLQGRGEKVRP